jgi:hypothetical protein
VLPTLIATCTMLHRSACLVALVAVPIAAQLRLCRSVSTFVAWVASWFLCVWRSMRAVHIEQPVSSFVAAVLIGLSDLDA